jgi:hypothetical protein
MFKHSRRIPINRTRIREARKRILNTGKARHHSSQKVLFAIRQGSLNYDVNGTIIFPAVLHGSETWSLTLREEHGQWVHEEALVVAGRGWGRGVVCGHSEWQSPTGGKMCSKINVLHEFFFHSVNFKLLSQ